MINFKPRIYYIRHVITLVIAQALNACAANAVIPDVNTTAPASLEVRPPKASVAAVVPKIDPPSKPVAERHNQVVQPLTVIRTGRTGNLQSPELNEVSGLAASVRYPGLLYAINDSGNSSVMYAINESGQSLEQWRINARNRDWEDMARISLAGENFLVIGDTGDNLRIHKSATLHLFREPALPANTDNLDPTHTIQFQYEDGPRNVEAFAAVGQTLYLLSKEPVGLNGPSPTGIYQLDLPENLHQLPSDKLLIARRIGKMPLRIGGMESRLAAALAGVDLSHPTALAFDAAGKTAYILTYREVLRVRRTGQQNWAEAFAQPAERLLSHKLAQAEALALSEGRSIWFTSENAGAPLWAIPLVAPL